MHPRLLPLLLAGLVPLPAIGLALAPQAAHAQAPVLAQPVVDLVPPGEIVGDGQTATVLYVVAYDLQGKPLADLGGRITAAEGDVGKTEAVAPGLFRATWTPPAVDADRTVDVTVRAKVTGHGAVTTKVPVTLAPATAHQVSMTANPAQVVLGQDQTATLTIRLTGGATSTQDGADLAVDASSGTVANVTPLGKGQYSLLFTAPSKLFPHLALITVADRRDPAGASAGLILPLSGKTGFPVVGLPGSNIVVRVGDKEYGPVPADASGKATVPLIVPPGVETATVISVLGDQRQETPLDLGVPTTNRIQLFPTSPIVGADGKTGTTVRVLVATPTGQPDPAASVQFAATSGTVGPAKHEGGGVYAATWTPAAGKAAETATVSVTVGDHKDEMPVRLLPARPASLSLTTDPASLGADTRSFEAVARVDGARGVSFGASGATASGDVQQRDGGAWARSFSVDADKSAAVAAAALVDASSNPLARVLVLPSTERITNDGQSRAVLTVLTVDSQGYPVPAMPVALSIARGDGSLESTTLTTDSHGVAHTGFTAGTVPGLVAVHAESSGHLGATGLLQLPAAAGAVDLPAAGDPTGSALTTAWDPLVQGAFLPRSGQAAVAVALPSPGAAPAGGAISGNIASLLIKPSAASVAPGGTVTLDIEAKDDSGRDAAGKTLQVFTNAGTADGITDLGDGRYRTRIVAPASGADTLRVTVLSTNSGVSSMVEVPVSATGPAWGIAAAAEPDEAPDESVVRETATMPVTNAGQPQVAQQEGLKEPGEFPWLRLRGGFLGGFYSYEQVPTMADGALYGDRIAFGGGETPAAGSAGFALHGKAWSPGMEYFGAEVNFRTTRYAVELADFSNTVIPDWVNDAQALLLARYPVDVDQTRLHVGARAGLGIGDFMVYRQDITADTPVLDYGPLVVPSFDIGAEIGLDYDARVWSTLSATFGLNGGGGLYSTQILGDLSVAVVDQLYIYANGGWVGRDTRVFVAGDSGNEEAGSLDDTMLMFGGGIGTQL